ARAAAASAALLLLRVWPLAGLTVTGGWTWGINLVAVAAGLLVQLEVLRTTRWPARTLAWWPLTPLLMLAILWRAVLLTLRRGGIVWRGTLYPLSALRAARRDGSTWR
ncbi:MAG: hypothetical protein ACXWC6_04145, partial [Ramlibacter sp.]